MLCGGLITREEAVLLAEAPLEELRAAANEIRVKRCGNGFDICTIINGKCGRCSEDCKYCAQSAHYHTACTETYPLLPTEELVERARQNAEQGVLRYSIVTSGRRLTEKDVDQVCVSFGLVGDKGEACFMGGVNAAISRDMLTTAGITVETDMKLMEKLGYEVRLCNE